MQDEKREQKLRNFRKNMKSYRERKKKDGFVQISFFIKKEYVEKVKEYVKYIRSII